LIASPPLKKKFGGFGSSIELGRSTGAEKDKGKKRLPFKMTMKKSEKSNIDLNER